VQYRNAIMPLLSLSNFFEVRRSSADETRQVIVFRDGDRSVGLVVDQILDIVNEPVTIQRTSKRSGVLGTVVLQHKVTDLVDVQTIIQSADPAFDPAAEAA